MVLKTSGTWYDQIREVTETEEYQTATIKILDRGLMEMGEYDANTDTYIGAGSEEDAIVYEGRARLIGVRWVQTDMGGASAPVTPQASATGMRRVVAALAPADRGAFFSYDGTRFDGW